MSRRMVISDTSKSRASSPTWIVCSSATRSRIRWRRSTAASGRAPDRRRGSPASQHPTPRAPRLTTRIDERCAIVFDYRGERPEPVKPPSDGRTTRRAPWHDWLGFRGQPAVRPPEHGSRPRGVGARRDDLQRGLLGAGRRHPGVRPVLGLQRLPAARTSSWATIISFFLNIPVLIMMALLAASMPRTGGDYVWVSRILSPPLALISNFGAALSAMIGATFWARYFAVSALGPVLVSIGAFIDNTDADRMGHQLGPEGPPAVGLPRRLRDDRPDDARSSSPARRPRSAGRTRSSSSP